MRKRWLVLIVLVVVLGIAGYVYRDWFPARSNTFATAGAENQALTFPEGFLWGVATSATQIERPQASDWAAFEREVLAGNRFHAKAELGTTSPGHIRNFGKWSEKVRAENTGFDTLYAQDIAMAAGMGVRAFRIGFDWSRLFPRAGMTEPAPEGIAHYKAVVAEMKRNNITPLVTLYHYVSPEWFFQPDASGKRGWERQDALEHWGRYVRAVADNFVPDVEHWCTLNEPLVYIYNGYLQGVYPPLEKRADVGAAASVYEALLRAHALAYKTLHETATARKARVNVGVAQNTANFAPLRNWALIDRLTTHAVAQAWDWDFLDAIESGRFKVALAGVDRPIEGLRGTQDYIGINYYQRVYIRGNTFNPMGFQSLENDPRAPGESRSELGWTNDPRGLYTILTTAHKKYRKPIYLLENGTCDGTADDVARQKYLVSHVREVWLAIHQGGADVRSYFQWSLLDNLEWAEGYDARFGLVAVDYENEFKRTPRPSAKLYSEIARANGLSPELLARTLSRTAPAR